MLGVPRRGHRGRGAQEVSEASAAAPADVAEADARAWAVGES